MRRIKTAFFILVFVIVGGFLHYVLPQHDIVRITSTEVIRTDFNWLNRPFYAQADSGASELATRDLRLINTEKRRTWLLGFFPRDSTRVMVYRNEDTGWIWPPYFKFDSSDLQAQAAANVSTNANPQWAVLTHYGWRNKYLSIYPNAIGIRPVEGPDVTVIPWFNIVFFFFLAIAWGFLRAVWRQFRERTIDPTMDDIEEQWDSVGHHLSERRGRFRRWLDTWRAKK
ncbi:DUF1523 family protein [Pseudooceanicola sp.]|uniref:DUF1523 family protein n=1 Tax=Pseudooceanicola sp. TaxID=1914328 RepID=UPI003516C909